MSKKLTVLILISSLVLVLASCATPADPPEDPAAPVVEEASEEIIPTDTALPPTEEPEVEEEESPMAEMKISSPAFAQEEAIPTQFSCDGDNVSPELVWTGVPESTASLVLIVDDPDAPVGVWDHWILFNIAPETAGIPQGGTAGTDGSNSWDRTGYGGPCPPGGTHRYFFKLYALDTTLDLPEGSYKGAIEEAMEGHILAYAELMGTYTR